MENVHRTSRRTWISNRVGIRKFRDSWNNLLKEKKNIDLKEILGEELYSQTEQKCSLSAMKCQHQQYAEISRDTAKSHLEEILESSKLETLSSQVEDLIRRQNDVKYERAVYQIAKYCNYPVQQITLKDASKALDFIPVEKPEVILTVQIFRPERRFGHDRYPHFIVEQEFFVLSSQYLTELRDKIDCVSDRAVPGDLSENPFIPPEMTCKDLYKSGFFFIDGMFFNDMRHPDCRDYSDIIINWSKRITSGIGPFTKCQMENVKFIDLEIQLGYPYLYVHQGYCEHLLVFTDMMMFDNYHVQNRAEYPLQIKQKPKKRIICMLCKIHVTEWIVRNNKRLPENPFYFCKSCFFNFNYDKENNKIGEFQAYRHIDRSALM